MLKAYPVLGKKKSAMLCEAFIEGAPRDAEGAVFFGVNATNQAEWVQVLKRCEPYYYIDNSYFDATRGTYFRVTRNALQHPGTGTSTGRRLHALALKLKPWIVDSERSDTAIVLEQSPDFMRMLHGCNPEASLQCMLGIARRAGMRPHVRGWDPNKLKQAASFAHQLAETRRVIAFSSAGAVQAAIEGVPYCVLDPHCAAAVFSTPPARLADRPERPGDLLRTMWLAVLADNQFTCTELANGTAWRMLTPAAKRQETTT